ncbi:hypothetical protein [uncultured Tateyamaria sp.]|uniref:hypothetical protein n=1 Tax=uncultured Tateyamaria sp. TaxID=455651 RepID=UPI0026210373|nr:hypothetical protein [uncultured Tateyamaria sp.]
MLGENLISDELGYLVGCGLEQHGCVMTDTITRGHPMRLHDRADLAIVLSGAVRTASRSGFAAHICGPTLILKSDIEKSYICVAQDLRLLSMSLETCRALIHDNPAFRDLFYIAFSSRLQTLLAVVSPEAIPPIH